jgi:hypothetical protein
MVASNFTMDKFAVQLRQDQAVSDQVVQLPNGDAPIKVSLWTIPGIGSNNSYPVAGAQTATWTLTIPASIASNLPGGAHNGDWLIFDMPTNIALTAGVQYGIQLEWPTVTPSVGQKLLIYEAISAADVAAFGQSPLERMAMHLHASPQSDPYTYDKTFRTENFAIIAAPVPEPATLGLLSFGGLFSLLIRRRRFQ